MFGADDLDILASCISLSDQLSPWSILNVLETISLIIEFSCVNALQWETQLDNGPQGIDIRGGCLFERREEGLFKARRIAYAENKLDAQRVKSIKEALLLAKKSGDRKFVNRCFPIQGGIVVYRARLRGPSRVSGFFAEFTIDHSFRNVAEKARGILWCIAPILGKAFEVYIASGAPQQERLSRREVDALQWAALGKNAWEIGRILRISERTVNFHLQNAYKKLAVANRSQALVKATKLGLLQTVTPAENLEMAAKMDPAKEES